MSARLTALVLTVLALSTSCSGDGGDGDTATTSPIKTFAPYEGQRHAPGRLTYDTQPPTQGQHTGQGWLRCDAYDEPVPNEFAVHSLEHGAVWVTYDPALDERDVATLKDLRSIDDEYVLVSPYEGQPAPVMATAWGRQLQVDDASDPDLEKFVRSLAGNGLGGELGAPCKGNGVLPNEADEVLGAQEAASPTPG